jgi:hypothetical protein
MATFAGARHEREPWETHGAGGPALHVLRWSVRPSVPSHGAGLADGNFAPGIPIRLFGQLREPLGSCCLSA